MDSVMMRTFRINNRMKGGLEGLSPLPKGPAPAPRDVEDPRPLPWAGLLVGAWLAGLSSVF